MNYPLPLKKVIHNTKYSINRVLNPGSIQVDWYKGFNNFGDILNPIVISHLTQRKILNVRSRYCNSTHLLAIGSILDRATSTSEVWGSGYISATSHFISKPKKVHAVRGPLTRELLLKQGVACPEIYGDPALLLPRFIANSETKKKYDLGIVPHYVDKSSEYLTDLPNSATVIDVQNPNPLQVLNQMLECKAIASSSMHGLIVADAYQIPTLWLQFSDKVVGKAFKFHDYYESIGVSNQTPFQVNSSVETKEIIQQCNLKKINLNLDQLLECFPKSFK